MTTRISYEKSTLLAHFDETLPKKLIQPAKRNDQDEPDVGIKSYTFKDYHFSGSYQGFLFKSCKFVHCTFEDVWGFFLYFKKCEFTDCEFKNSRFSHGQFGWTELSFYNCKFRNVQIDEGDMDNTIFEKCDFHKFELAEDLFNVHFVSCEFEASMFRSFRYYPPGTEIEEDTKDVTFDSCRIMDCYFNTVDLRNTSIIDSTLYFSVFQDCTLNDETIEIRDIEIRPVYASMDFQTILKSDLNNPEILKAYFNIHAFDYKEKIAQISSQTDYKKIFISYSFKDRAFAAALDDTLRNFGIKTFLWEKDAPGGQYLEDIMTKNVWEHEILLFIASEHSLKSKACQFELSTARQKQEELWKNIFFPIHIDPYLFEVKQNQIRPIEKSPEYWNNIQELKRVNSLDFSQAAKLYLKDRKSFDKFILDKIVKQIQST